MPVLSSAVRVQQKDLAHANKDDTHSFQELGRNEMTARLFYHDQQKDLAHVNK